MDREADVVYRYDGSFEGFLCCVFESVYAHEIPFAILPHSSPMATLFPEKLIETDPAKARPKSWARGRAAAWPTPFFPAARRRSC